MAAGSSPPRDQPRMISGNLDDAGTMNEFDELSKQTTMQSVASSRT